MPRLEQAKPSDNTNTRAEDTSPALAFDIRTDYFPRYPATAASKELPTLILDGSKSSEKQSSPKNSMCLPERMY